MRALTVVSKSAWRPAIRREHAFVALALAQDVQVTFIEAANDIRALSLRHARAWMAGLGGAVHPSAAEALTLIGRSVIVPGHRGRAAEAADALLLRHVLSGRADPSVTICSVPWNWPGLAPRRRRVFDCADDWTALFPARRSVRFRDLFRRIGAEADEVIVASDAVSHLFGDRPVTVVPNGTGSAGIAARPSPPPGSGRLAYVGTLSERFDTGTVSALLARLADWRLDLYGPCQYSSHGDRPSPELEQLLRSHPGRVEWHGPISRAAVPAAIDGADVLIVPIKPEMAVGQSSMKLYDIAARGRPAVVAAGVAGPGDQEPPGLHVASGIDEWAAGVTAAGDEEAGLAGRRIAWSRGHTWETRWPAWSAAVFGGEVPVR